MFSGLILKRTPGLAWFLKQAPVAIPSRGLCGGSRGSQGRLADVQFVRTATPKSNHAVQTSAAIRSLLMMISAVLIWVFFSKMEKRRGQQQETQQKRPSRRQLRKRIK